MRIAIFGTGSIGLGYAAMLSKAGHDPVLFSLSGKSGKDLYGKTIKASGGLEHSFTCDVTDDMQEALTGADACIIATTANSHASIMDQLAVHLDSTQRVLVSAELSLSGDYLAAALAKAGKTTSILALGTTILTGRRKQSAEVNIGILRKECKAAIILADDHPTEFDFWRGLFGNVIQEAPSRLWVLFSNLNPTIHAGNALCNFTRIENGEDWSN